MRSCPWSCPLFLDDDMKRYLSNLQITKRKGMANSTNYQIMIQSYLDRMKPYTKLV